MDSALGRQLANRNVGLGHGGVNAHRCDGVSRYPISACDPRADIGDRNGVSAGGASESGLTVMND